MVGIVNKPDINYGIWASNGDVAVPSSEKVEIGHIIEKPKKEIVNWIENRQDQFMAYLNQVGVSEWDSKTTYKSNISFVNRSGTVYKAKSQNIDKDPTLNQDIWEISWATYSDFYNLSNRVENIETVDEYLDFYVSRANPVMLGEAKAPSYLLSGIKESSVGLSLDSEGNPIIKKGDDTSFRFKTVTNLNSPTNDVVTMDILLRFIQIYKVGDLYLTTNSGNPSTLLGYGTWVRYAEGRSLVGYSGNVSNSIPEWVKTNGSEFGSYTHTLNVDETPEHSHNIVNIAGSHGVPDTGVTVGAREGDGSLNSTYRTTTVGGNHPHNNVQPSKVVFIWLRTS